MVTSDWNSGLFIPHPTQTPKTRRSGCRSPAPRLHQRLPSDDRVEGFSLLGSPFGRRFVVAHTLKAKLDARTPRPMVPLQEKRYEAFLVPSSPPPDTSQGDSEVPPSAHRRASGIETAFLGTICLQGVCAHLWTVPHIQPLPQGRVRPRGGQPQ